MRTNTFRRRRLYTTNTILLLSSPPARLVDTASALSAVVEEI